VQEQAVRHEGGPLLVLAGAGSGKTRVLTYRAAHLVSDRRVNPRRILAVTFTNKAAGEMKRRVAELVGANLEPAWIGTFHSMCARMLRREARWAWWTAGFSIYDETDQLDLVKESMKRAGVAGTSFAPRALLSAISRSKDRLLSAEAYAALAVGYFEECVAKVYREYERGLLANNALDFDDLIMKAVELLRANEPVLNVYAERFEHVLVDEYQDTSHAQYELVNLLSSRHRNICVVGDDDQSIYGWRGADITNILDFEKDHPDATVIKLEQNYRSTKSILAAAHDVVSRNVRRKEKKLWTGRPAGRKPLLSRVPNEYSEADCIRDRITQLMAEEHLSYHDFAILYRTHAQSRVIEDSLRRAGIVYDIVGGVRFYERAEVKDVLAYLRVISNPADSVSLRRIVNVPPRKIGDRTLARIEAHAARRGLGLLAAAEQVDDIEGVSAAARASLRSLVGALSAARRAADRCGPSRRRRRLGVSRVAPGTEG
jgi:DNA helicase-2/ATP-dependent DNA helicase PcrA